jgi:formyltetrahydrofolate-dependent phosphoribosylglycinamide formyltransferase
MNNSLQKNIVIFASGAGSNAQKIIDYFRENEQVKIALIVCNKPNAGVLDIAAKENIPTLVITKNEFLQTGYLDPIKSFHPDLIVLAGFLLKIPGVLIAAFPQKIINIHPALLPAHGGKGMYGNAVHTAVISSKEKVSGITIHYVDEIYDNGKVIFQESCEVTESDTAESLSNKIHKLEHEFYPKTIDLLLKETNH